MLQNIRDRSSGIIAKFIVGLIAVTFVVTGVNFFVVGDGDPVVAEVGAIEIKESRFVERLEQERRRLLQVVQDPALIDESRLRQGVLATLIEEAVALDFAEQLGFGAPERVVDQIILDVPQFQRDGRFDPALYDQTLGQMGLSRLGFRESLKRDLLDYQVRGAIDGSVLVLPNEAARLTRLQGQLRSGQLAVLTNEAIAQIPVQITEDAIESTYTQNQASYLSSESAVLEYVTLSIEDFRDDVEVTEEEVRAAYAAEVAAAAQETERRARHILINAGEGALERITDLKAQIDAGTPFEVLAREQSDDIASREAGGDLGFAPVGTFVPEFEAALERLSLNQVSEPVETQFGYHLIEVLETRARNVDPFERRAIAIREALEDQQAAQLLGNSIEEFSNIAFSGSLEELRTVYGVEIQRSDLVTSTQGTGLFASPGMLRRAFDPVLRESNLNAEVFEVEPGLWMTFRIAEYQPATQQPLEAVRDQIKSELENTARFEQANQLIERIEAHWQTAQSGLPSDLDTSLVTLFDFSEIGRDGNERVNPDWLRVAFNAPAPTSTPSTAREAVAGRPLIVARVDAIRLPETDTSASAELVSALQDIRVQQEAAEFWSRINAKSEVSRP